MMIISIIEMMVAAASAPHKSKLMVLVALHYLSCRLTLNPQLYNLSANLH